MTLLILECTPNKDGAREGLILSEFLSLMGKETEEIAFREFETKQEFLKFLSNDNKVSGYDCVHISGHGSVEDKIAKFQLPGGR